MRKDPLFSRLFITSAGVVLLFLLLIIVQTGCGGNGTNNNEDLTEVSDGDTSSAPVLSGNVPSEVYIPNPSSNDTLNRPAFDRFSWQTFIALCWPVTPGQRGVPLNPNDPNTFLSMSNSTPVVWTSYKNQWDLFGQGQQTPSAWDSWTNPVNICNTGQAVKHVFGTAKSRMNVIPGDGSESFSVPLVDQDSNYVLFEMRYNEVQYNFIVQNGLYLNINLLKYRQTHGDTVAMPSSTATSQGSILVKASWKLLTAKDDTTRYYFVDDWVFDPVINQCRKMRMGLVGLHIAQKVDSFPQWIWSSFEQVDNVPGAANAKTPYSFNNGVDTPATTIHGYANMPPSDTLYPKNRRRPVQVVRLNEIPTTPQGQSTVDINRMYQAAAGNTWMRYYQLVITQWPTNSSSFKQFTSGGIYPKDCGQPFPVNNCVNTTMETYMQSRGDAVGTGGNSCMGCHYTAPKTDFSWSLQLRSH